MTYRASKKARKLWSEQANAKQERDRLAGETPKPPEEVDRSIFITIRRPGTGEDVEFQLLEGSRINHLNVIEVVANMVGLLRRRGEAYPPGGGVNKSTAARWVRGEIDIQFAHWSALVRATQPSGNP